MPTTVEDPVIRGQANSYVIALYDELTTENGAPTPGTENQAVDFILADPELRRAVANWAATARPLEATTAPPQRLPQDALYYALRARLEASLEQPVFKRPSQSGH